MNMGKHIIHLVSNKEWGGGEQYVYDLCARLKADGYRITMFTRKVEAVTGRMSELGVPLFSLPLGGAFDAVSAVRLARFLRKEDECVMCTHNFKDAFTAVYARALSGNSRVRIVTTRHLVRRGKNSPLHRWMYRHVDKIIFDSELSRDEFASGCPDIAPRLDLCVVPIGIMVPKDISRVDMRKELGIPENAVLAMFHGRIDVEKGLDVLVDAMRILKEENIYLILIGSGNDGYVESLKRKISDYGMDKRIVLAGFRRPVLPCLGSCDFGLLPSVVREGYPLSPMEYMSQGRCVIATDNGGQKEYLTDGVNALLVRPGDAEGLAMSMRRLADDVELRGKLSHRAQADYKEKMSYDSFIQRIEKAYEH